MQIVKKRVFQVEGIVDVEFCQWEFVWCVQGNNEEVSEVEVK